MLINFATFIRFIIVLTGNDLEIPVRERRMKYLNSKSNRLAFVDIDQRAIKESGIKHSAFSQGDRV